jgi:hypothetical protein
MLTFFMAPAVAAHELIFTTTVFFMMLVCSSSIFVESSCSAVLVQQIGHVKSVPLYLYLPNTRR